MNHILNRLCDHSEMGHLWWVFFFWYLNLESPLKLSNDFVPCKNYIKWLSMWCQIFYSTLWQNKQNKVLGDRYELWHILVAEILTFFSNSAYRLHIFYILETVENYLQQWLMKQWNIKNFDGVGSNLDMDTYVKQCFWELVSLCLTCNRLATCRIRDGFGSFEL